jgi:diadenosine tetraphosphate (Ap4A) HIT family hydrolase
MTTPTPCPLCTNLSPILYDTPYWRLALNRNQNLLGKTMLVLRRHLETVPDLTPAEWADLHTQLRTATTLLTRAFSPDHFNYAFLQNQDRHIHLHIIPRYASPRTFSGLTFTDPDYPNHYAVPSHPNLLSPAQLTALTSHLLSQLIPNP